MAKNTKSSHTDMNLWIFDANALFTELLDDIRHSPKLLESKTQRNFMRHTPSKICKTRMFFPLAKSTDNQWYTKPDFL